MREILFRGQTRRYGEKVWAGTGEKLPGNWVYGGIFPGTGDFSVIYGGNSETLEISTLEKHVVYSDTVGQYTGLMDKNGKRIFEGDVIRSHNGKVFEVKFGQHMDDENLYQACGWYVHGDYGTLSFGEDWGGHEIIGNIHDNPDLLKGGEGDC